MKISARVESSKGKHEIQTSTDQYVHTITIPPKTQGLGSSVNGGELLLLALATCYCNDIYREAAKRGIRVDAVEVLVDGEFGAAGEPATNVRYHARITAGASEADIRALAIETDRVAEIQNTLRMATPVTLGDIKAVSV
jgi:organic hydroperoxide reductase OsmC/OhrA